MMAALNRFKGRGLALRVRAWSRAAGVLDSLKAVSVGGGASGGDGEGAVAIVAAMPVGGVAGGELPSLASLLSFRRLALLSRSRLLLPE